MNKHTRAHKLTSRIHKHKYVPVPVVDLHGYQMIDHGLGVLWETSYVDTLKTK